MDVTPLIGFVVFWVSLVSTSIFVTAKTRRVTVAAIAATLFAAVLIQVVALFHLGYIEPFHQVAFAFSVLVGLPVALLVAFATRRYLRRRDHGWP